MTKQNPSWHRHAGDTSDDIIVEVSQAVGTDLSGVSSVAGVLTHISTAATVALSGAIHSSSDRQIVLTLGTWLQSTAVAGDNYYVEAVLTMSDGDVETYPEDPRRRPVLAIE